MVEVESLEFQNETQGPFGKLRAGSSTPDLRAKGARQSSAQDDTGVVRSECLEHGNSEFETMLRVLAEC
jgi:hypothetical protein